eukprot:1194120-Prorocentrum_minimum.AAC.1
MECRAGKFTVAGRMKTPKLPSQGLILKFELDKYAMVTGHTHESFAKVALPSHAVGPWDC